MLAIKYNLHVLNFRETGDRKRSVVLLNREHLIETEKNCPVIIYSSLEKSIFCITVLFALYSQPIFLTEHPVVPISSL